MSRRKSQPSLNIFLNGRLVGLLRKEKAGAINFQYDNSWLSWENALPVSVSLPLREDRYSGEPVVAVFDNLLPDNLAIRRRLAERVKAGGYDTYSLLAAIGRDCVGALQLLPDEENPGTAGEVRGDPISSKEIAAVLDALSKAPLGVTEDDEFRISIAGAQEKTALLFWKERWHIPHGSTPTTHILKPQIGLRKDGVDLSQSVENEHFCMRLAEGLGLPVAKTEIQEFGGTRALIIERFDRFWTKNKKLLRLPQEDCCQGLSVSPTRKYEPQGGPGIRQILDFLKGSDDPENDRRMFMKAQIVFWLLGATDGHAKNFSIFLSPGGRFRLTPLYDIMSIQPNVDAGQVKHSGMKLAMCVGRKRHYVVNSISPRHFVETGKLSGLADDVIPGLFDELLEKAPLAIEQVLSELPRHFPEKLTASICKGINLRLRQLQHNSK